MECKKEETYQTPILLVIFDKPEKTKKVLEAIRHIRPTRLFVVCDGPREWIEGEAEKVILSRQLIDSVKIEIPVETKYFPSNIGIAQTFSQGINWFFEHVDMGIILESDCLPGLDFFHFCDEMLNKYKNDERIWHISGENHQRGKLRGRGTYYFSQIPHIWGWATWRRAWRNYDPHMTDFPMIKESNEFKNRFLSKKQYGVWKKLFEKTYRGQIQTWDYQWTYAIIKNDALAIIPNYNLVSNIGFGSDALHTKDTFSPFANVPIQKLPNIIHPDTIALDREATTFTFYQNICGRYSVRSILAKIYFAIANRVRHYLRLSREN